MVLALSVVSESIVVLGAANHFTLAVVLFPLSISIASVWIDMRKSDHQAAWEFRTAEKPVSLKARFLRSFLLLVYPQLLILALALSRLNSSSEYDPADLAPVFILISAIMATVGWIYTTYANALKARQTATIEYLSRIISSERHRNHTRALKQFIQKVSSDGSDKLGDHHFSIQEIDGFNTSGETVAVDGLEYTFSDVCRYFIGYLEHLALSVRVGMYDYDIVQRQRRRRILLYYNTLFSLILRESRARRKRIPGRYQYLRGNDLMENFIWLVSHMEGPGRINKDYDAVALIDPRRNRPPNKAMPDREKYELVADFDEI
jgi:archaellum component FlaF (FlaF/FlaG flagellin family)